MKRAEFQNKLQEIIKDHGDAIADGFRKFRIQAPLTEENVLLAYVRNGDEFASAVESYIEAAELSHYAGTEEKAVNQIPKGSAAAGIIPEIEEAEVPKGPGSSDLVSSYPRKPQRSLFGDFLEIGVELVTGKEIIDPEETPKTEDPDPEKEDKKIVGLQPVLFWTLLGVITLGLLTLIFKRLNQ